VRLPMRSHGLRSTPRSLPSAVADGSGRHDSVQSGGDE
jgi:hypothetical protein